YMNDTVKEWIDKAERDLATAKRELAAVEQPNYDAVCFHAQQGIEKLMKALLIQLGAIPTKTHDLSFLDQLLSPVCPKWSWPSDDLRFLTRAAVAFRYPGESADREEAAQALDISSRLRGKLLLLLKES
ncbi:MAG: HEPN domain-containing protein, partial [Desulfobaccales bacterium]